MRGRVFVRSRVAVGLRACLRLCEVCAEAACSASVTAVGEKEPAFVGQPPVEPVLQASPGILAEFRRASGAAVDAKSDGSCIRIIVRSCSAVTNPGGMPAWRSASKADFRAR